MNTYTVKVCTPEGVRKFDELGFESGAVAEAVAARFGGECGVTVLPK